MANLRYNNGAEGFCRGDFNLPTDNLKMVCMTAGYTFSQAHEFLSDIVAGNRVATTPNLAGKTITDGVFNCTNPVIPSVAAGSTITQVAFYKDTGVESTSRLIAFWDRDPGDQPISLPTNGSDVTITMPAGGVPIASN